MDLCSQHLTLKTKVKQGVTRGGQRPIIIWDTGKIIIGADCATGPGRQAVLRVGCQQLVFCVIYIIE